MKIVREASLTQPRLSRSQLPDLVAEYVMDQIFSGSLKAGEFVRMEPIAEAVGVSLTPVREGLVALSSEGFLTAVPRRGFMVATLTREDVKDLFWAQAQLAGELASRAAARISVDELDALDQLQQRGDHALMNGDVDAITRLGPEFHRLINRSARSARLARLNQTVVGHLPTEFYAALESNADASAVAHRGIFDSIVQRDSARAEKLMRVHVVGGGEVIVHMLEERGLWADRADDEWGSPA